MLNIVDNAFIFLIQTLFNLYILALLLRLILQWSGAHFYNPISQFIIKITNPVVKPLRKLIPPFKGIDLATTIILIVLQIIKLLIIIALKTGAFANLFGLLIMAFGDIVSLILNVYFYAIIIAAILTWIGPQSPNPFTEVLYLVTEPLLRPARRLIPPIGGFDISPIPVLIVLQLLSILIANPLIAIGFRLAIG